MKQNFGNKFPVLSKIKSPKDLNSVKDLNALCKEIRLKLIEVISKNGGHLSSNLGVVELTVALNKIFNNSEDKIVWDVGHQSYVHKMLTGRFDKIDTVRLEGGLSGFTNSSESLFDPFSAGHSSTSISAALGLAESKRILEKSGHVVAVIGDGALTGGLAYEGLNNAGRFKKNFIIVLNDNKMSISKNVGAVARYLSAARIKPSYMKAKNFIDRFLEKTYAGLKIKNLMKKSKSILKKMIYKNSIFEDMGFAYYGPVDGHNLDQLHRVLTIAKGLNKPTVVHVVTNKGKGYKFAEKHPGAYHGVSAFNVLTGLNCLSDDVTFSQKFGEAIYNAAKHDSRICAITAAMSEATGLENFKNKYKSRFFDVGIAEGHAATFAGGLAAGGMIPVFAVYSSFLQRAYDQIIHDIAIQGVKVVLAIDRAGLIGQDGETHQGIFDVPFLNTVPHITVYAPAFLEETELMFNSAVFKCSGASAIRYPKGTELKKPVEFKYTGNDFDFYGDNTAKTLIVTYGRIFSSAYFAAELLKNRDREEVCVLKLNVIKPINQNAVSESLKFKNIIFFEESMKSCGVGEKFGAQLLGQEFNGNYKIKAIDDEFVPHASVDAQLKKFSLDSIGMADYICQTFEF